MGASAQAHLYDGGMVMVQGLEGMRHRWLIKFWVDVFEHFADGRGLVHANDVRVTVDILLRSLQSFRGAQHRPGASSLLGSLSPPFLLKSLDARNRSLHPWQATALCCQTIWRCCR